MPRLFAIRRHAYLAPGYGQSATPFEVEFPEAHLFFRDHGIVFTEDPLRCDLFVASHIFPPWWNTWTRKAQLLLRYQGRRRFLIWSDEPWNTDPQRLRWSRLQPAAHTMNIYTGDVLVSNFTVAHPSISQNLSFKKLEDCPEQGKARIVGLVGYVAEPKPRIVQGINRDLNWLRMEFLKEGFRHHRIDIYGPNWPQGMSKEDSRAGNWWDRKKEILRNYDICVALENTNFDHYCTEKIWHAIAGGCLPIYYGKDNRIYDTFLRNSFIDASEFASVQDIYAFIGTMSREEYVTRYNRCVEANNVAAAVLDPEAERRAVLAKVVERIYEITRGRASHSVRT